MTLDVMARAMVWIDEWSWACCGDPLQVGVAVSFRARPRRLLPADAFDGGELGDAAAMVTHVEDSHAGDEPGLVTLSGVVLEIRELRAEYLADEGGNYTVSPGTLAEVRHDQLLRPVLTQDGEDDPCLVPSDADLEEPPAGALTFGVAGTATFGWFALPRAHSDYPPLTRTSGYLVTLDLGRHDR